MTGLPISNGICLSVFIFMSVSFLAVQAGADGFQIDMTSEELLSMDLGRSISELDINETAFIAADEICIYDSTLRIAAGALSFRTAEPETAFKINRLTNFKVSISFHISEPDSGLFPMNEIELAAERDQLLREHFVRKGLPPVCQQEQDVLPSEADFVWREVISVNEYNSFTELYEGRRINVIP